MATASATRAFVSRANQRLGAGSGRERTLGKLAVTPFGFGAYRAADDANSAEVGPAGQPRCVALQNALEDGVLNVIDTSSTYADGASESLIGDVLADTLARGTVRREEIVVVTKIGHVPEGHDPPETVPIARHTGGRPGKHSIHPEWLRQQLQISTSRLGTAPDIVLLHNPEFALSDAKNRKVGTAAAHDVFHCSLQKAFEELEALTSEGSIGHCYGVSTNPCGCWWSVTGGQNGYEAVSLPRLIEDAIAAGGEDHRMRALQLPLNLLELGAAMGHYTPHLPWEQAEALGVLPSALRCAREHGISVMANRPLHAIPPPGIATGDWNTDGGGLQDSGPKDFIKLRDESPSPPVLTLLRQLVARECAGSATPPPLARPSGTEFFASPMTAQTDGGVQSLQRLALLVAASTPNVDVVLCGYACRSPLHRWVDPPKCRAIHGHAYLRRTTRTDRLSADNMMVAIAFADLLAQGETPALRGRLGRGEWVGQPRSGDVLGYI